MIHIHEDDWGMRNLCPLAALRSAADDVAAAAAAGERNLSPDGAGWREMHVAAPPVTDYLAAGLRVADFAGALGPLLPRVLLFNSTASAGFHSDSQDPWGTYETEAYCFGFDASCFLKLETEGELVQTIWFECTTNDPAQLAALRRAIETVDRLVPSAIVDYWNDMTGPVGDAAFLDAYFEAFASSSSS